MGHLLQAWNQLCRSNESCGELVIFGVFKDMLSLFVCA